MNNACLLNGEEATSLCLLPSRQHGATLGKGSLMYERKRPRHLSISHKLQNATKVQQNKTGILFESLNKGNQLNGI